MNANTTATVTPVVGQGVTEILWTDTIGYVVTAVAKSGKSITIEILNEVDASTGHAPADMQNGWPLWDHKYTTEELVTMRSGFSKTARMRKDGKFYLAGSTRPLSLTGARFRRDYSY